MKKTALIMTLSILTTTLGPATAAERIGPDAVEEKIAAMTLEEKIDFIGGFEEFNIRGYPQHGIPQIRMADGPVGVRNYGPATAFPASINLAATFDRDLAYRTGRAIGMEARARNVHLVLGPGMNIYRVPLNGRNFEYLGEDPYLAGQMAVAHIRGVQDQGVMANAKHFVANNQEYNRHHVSSDMDERTMREIYLPAFEASVVEGGVASVMSAYNLVNGVHATQHGYLNNVVLKGEWGFEGFVVSDWVSTYDALGAARGGLDLEMPSAAFMNRENLLPAIASGELEEAVIDDKVRRILRTLDRFGYLRRADLAEGFEADAAEVRQTALDAARGGMVLLRNAAGQLPLDRSALRHVAVIGPNGHPLVAGAGGSSATTPLHALSLLEAVQQAAGDEVRVSFAPGVFTGAPYPEGIWDSNPFYVYRDGEAVPGVEAEFFAGKALAGEPIHRRHYEKLDLQDGDLWDNEGVPWRDFSARFTTRLRPEVSGHYTIAAAGDDGFRVYLDGVRIIDLWRDQGTTPGKHEVFLNGGQEYRVTVEYYQSGGGSVIRLGALPVDIGQAPAAYPEEALALAREADAVIMAVGFGPTTESESFDRTFELPYGQADLIRQVAAVNDNVVVVLNAGGNVAMDDWIDGVGALLMAWYPGQEGNRAAAEILFGETNPSGKLPASFERRLEDNPSFAHYHDDDGDLRVFYGEGIFVGYRHWDRVEAQPRFPFGHGLSYTTFEYSDLAVDRSSFKAGETVRVTLNVRNTGARAGAEAVQVYVADAEASLPRPVKELKGFAKVHLQPGETKQVTVELPPRAFMFYDPEARRWTAEPGAFRILVGASSADIRLDADVTLD